MAGIPWYDKGLHFSCRRCGNCCGGAPGYVWVSDEEIVALAAELGMPAADFERRYVRPVDGRGKSLVEQANYDCIFFLPGQGCKVYDSRPRQCRTWPFWRSSMRTEGDWQMASENCPGMGRGELYDAARIQATSETDGLPG